MFTLGPLAFPVAAFAGLLAFIVFSILVALGKRRLTPRLDAWSNWALLIGLLTARLAHVAVHWETFSTEPLRLLMVWQGGFDWVAGFTAAFVVTALFNMPLKARAAGLAILCITALTALLADQTLNRSHEGVRLPDVTVFDTNGQTVPLSTYAQGPVIINLWATWCPPCRRELPALVAHQKKHPSLPVLLVNLEEDPTTVQTYLDNAGLQLQTLLFDRSSALPKALKTAGVPVTLFFHDGELIELHAGEISPEALQSKSDAILR